MRTSNYRYTYIDILTRNIEGLKKYTHDVSLKGYFEQFDNGAFRKLVKFSRGV